MKMSKGKKTLVFVIAVLFLALPILIFQLLLHLNRLDNEDVLSLLKDYPQNQDMVVVVDDQWIYYRDQVMELEHDTEKFLYITKERTYFSRMSDDQKTFSIYCLEHDDREEKRIFSKEYGDGDAYAIMYDELYAFIKAEGQYYRYDYRSGEYEHIGDTDERLIEYGESTSANDYSSKKSGYAYTVTRIKDGVSKHIKAEDIIENSPLADSMDGIHKLYLYGVTISGDKIYVSCYASTEVFAVYEYDFESEQYSFYSWQRVIGIDGTSFFFLTE